MIALALMLFAQATTGLQIEIHENHRTGQDLIKYIYSATALLYQQSADGGMHMDCTATAFEKTEKGYLFATASHCVGETDKDHERVEVTKTRFYITFDEKEEKKFYPAQVIMAGYQPKGDDFSILSIETGDIIPLVPLGDEKLEEAGSAVVNVASPNGLGKQAFHGYISSPFVDRPVIEEDINWQGVMLLQIQSGPGSSGSAIISAKQEAVIGFLVGHFGENTFVMPVSRFRAFRKAVEDGKYRYFKKEQVEDLTPGKPTGKIISVPATGWFQAKPERLDVPNRD